MTDDFAAYNKAILNWGYATRTKLKFSIARLSMKGKGDLMRSLVTKARWDYGEIDRLEFSFVRHGVFFHKGVGRGYFIQGGKVVRGYKSKVLRGLSGRQEVKGGLVFVSGPHRRRPKEWFTPILDKGIPNFIDQIIKTTIDVLVWPNLPFSST